MSYANHPNAALIDEVLAHVRVHPQRWHAAWHAACAADRGAARDVAWDVAWDIARGAGWGATGDADLGAGWGAVCALVAYPEEAAALLRQDPDVVRMVASTGNHAAVLLLPATIAMASTLRRRTT